MALRRGVRDVLWMAGGAGLVVAIALVVLDVQARTDPGAHIAARAQRLGQIDQMRVALASASDSALLAVLATREEDSRGFANAARQAIQAVDQRRQDLASLLDQPEDRDRLSSFAADFEELRRVDDELLALAGRNTNLKAYDLAYGPAADALATMNGALDRLARPAGDAPDPDGVAARALRAEVAALVIQSLLPPHIAAGSEATMDQLETRMEEQERQVRLALEQLQDEAQPAAASELQAAAAAWSEYLGLKSQIVALSRDNTNVRSLALVLDRRRSLLLGCQEGLDALRQAIDERPVPGATRGPPPKPR